MARPRAALEMLAGQDCPRIVWGGNYFSDILPPGDKWLVWDKNQRIDQSDCELAWSSLSGALRVFNLGRHALNLDGAVHPTQKPVALMEWCLGFIMCRRIDEAMRQPRLDLPEPQKVAVQEDLF